MLLLLEAIRVECRACLRFATKGEEEVLLGTDDESGCDDGKPPPPLLPLLLVLNDVDDIGSNNSRIFSIRAASKSGASIDSNPRIDTSKRTASFSTTRS